MNGSLPVADTTQRFLDWQQAQPEDFTHSSPESLVSEGHQYGYPELTENMALNTISLDNNNNHLAWTNNRQSVESLSPRSGFSLPPSAPEEFEVKGESGLKMPKVGRPLSTQIASPGSYTTPTHNRRRNQNREAQRAFRARQRQHLEELAQENETLIVRNRELEERCVKLSRAYETVLSDRMDLTGSQATLEAFRVPRSAMSRREEEGRK